MTADNGYGTTTDASNNGQAFTVDTAVPPGPFAIAGPVSSVETEDPTLTWEPSVDAVSYDVSVSQASNCNNPLQTYSGVVSTSQQLDPLVDGTYYYSAKLKQSGGKLSGEP